jgi:selenide,water dikinase
MLSPLLQGATETLNAAGASLVGGHTGEGAELALGFAVNGLIDRQQVLRKHGARPGDRLILSKALGTGTLFAAQMQYQAQGRWIAAAIDSMLLSNQQAAACFYRHGATACTDVTGFGLIGHLLEMLQAATVHAELSLMDLPVLDGALQCIERKIFSTLYPQNLQQRIVLQADPELESTTRYPLLFDPQTAGGLLGCIPQLSAPACLSELHKLGYADAAIIGTITEPGQPAAGSIRLTLQK